MTLPSDFVLTQNNLQDFEECPRRFELRHLLHLQWPAPQSEPILELERHMLLGERFHRLAQQSFLGLPAESLASQAADEDLADWWQTFVDDRLIQGLTARRWPEITLSMPFMGYRLLCKLDLLTADDDQHFTIYDWKTNTRRPSSQKLKERWQTRLYPFILQHAAPGLSGGQTLAPEQIEMVYWFTAEPARPIRFSFTSDESDGVAHLLQQRIAEINTTLPDRFTLCSDEHLCAFCEYRSLCERGEPGSLLDTESDFEPPDTTAGLELDQIGEILL